jgi:hypothetical protein
MMTDGEAYLVEDPVPLGPRGDYKPKFAGHLPFSRFFDDAVWTGRRHAMVTPTQIDRFGQTNLSALGGTHQQPKVQMLGVRGFPGNSIYHPNSMFIPAHSTRVFCAGEVDMVSSAGYNPAKRIAGGNYERHRPAPHRHQPVRHGLRLAPITPSASSRFTPASASTKSRPPPAFRLSPPTIWPKLPSPMKQRSASSPGSTRTIRAAASSRTTRPPARRPA